MKRAPSCDGHLLGQRLRARGHQRPDERAIGRRFRCKDHERLVGPAASPRTPSIRARCARRQDGGSPWSLLRASGHRGRATARRTPRSPRISSTNAWTACVAPPRDVGAKRAHREPRDAFPVRLHAAHVRIDEDEPQDVAPLRATASCSRSASRLPRRSTRRRPTSPSARSPAPRRANRARAARAAIHGRLRDSALPAGGRRRSGTGARARRRSAAARGRAGRARRPTRPAAPLFEPRVPRGAHVRTLGDFLAPQAWRAAPRGRQAERGRIEFLAAAKVGAEQVVGASAIAC